MSSLLSRATCSSPVSIYHNIIKVFLIGCIVLTVGLLVINLHLAKAFDEQNSMKSYLPAVIKPRPQPICGQIVRVSGVLTSDTVWDASRTYIVDGDITVRHDVTLSIPPGTVIKFEYDRGIQVEGTLIAQGNSTNPIFFTSSRNDNACGDTNGDGTASVPAAGDWRWIGFAEGSNPISTIQYAVIEYGGQDEVPGTNNLRAPIRMINVTPTLEHITLQHNYRNAAQIVGGNWTSQTLSSTTVVYWLYDAGDLILLPRNTLTIAPGVKIKIAYDHGIYVQGLLNMQGNQAQPITITSDRDDTVCGLGAGNEPVCDTNDDGTATVPETGDWRWIEFDQESDPNGSISHAIIRYGGQNEVPGDNHWRAPIRMFNVVPNLQNITLEYNYRNAAQLIGGNWTSQVLNSTTVLYWIYDGDIVVLPRNTFTVEPGVKIKIEYDHGMLVQGIVSIRGHQAQPVVITSPHDDSICGVGAAGEGICDTNNNGVATIPNTGDWRWIDFVETDDVGSIIEYTIVKYGGQNEVPGDNHWRAPIRMFNISPTLNHITLEHNYRNAAQIIGGNWTSQTLSSTTVIYWLYDSGDVVILPRNTLIVEPDVKIKVAYDHGINAQGILQLAGTESQPIVITSDRDDTVCGLGVAGEPICDTNNDIIATVPNMGDWRWITFPANSDVGSIISHAVIRYGGQNEVPGNNQWLAVVLIDSASPTISRVAFNNNHRAIDFFNNAAPLLTCNDVTNSLDTSWYTYAGMYNWNTANVIVTEDHWWDDSSGPKHPSNPSGVGHAVSDGIDFAPWATSPCTDFNLAP